MPRPANSYIRWNREEDQQTLREVNHGAFETAYSYIFTHEELEGLFQHRLEVSSTGDENREGRLGVLVAEMDDEIVGFATLVRLKDGDGELQSFYVLPEYQGRGVGLALWEQSLEALRQEGFAAMQIWVLEDAEAVGFYERRGCERVGEGTFTIGVHSEKTLNYRATF